MRHKQLGFLPTGVTLYALIGFVAVICGLSLAVAYYKNSASRADAEAKTARLERDQYRANYEASEAARSREHARAEELAAIGADLEKEKDELKEQHQRDIAAVRAGAIRLRVPGICPANPEANATPAERNDATTGELPPEITNDLLGLANDADEVVKQLGACQDTIRRYLAQ